MNFAAPQLIAGILWISPAIQTAATLGLLAGASTLRRNLGAQRTNAGTIAAFGAAILLLHFGYFLAPLWWRSGRHLLGAATMLPVALLVLGSLLVLVTQTHFLRDVARWAVHRRLAAVAAASILVIAYVGPLVLMLAAWG